MAPIRAVPSPRRGMQVAWSIENKYRPFCGERCKMIDLGQWATEGYRVPQAEPPDSGEDQGQPPSQ